VLLRLVLQWKASGLNAVAYAYRPLVAPAELDVAARLSRNGFFAISENEEGTKEFVQFGVGIPEGTEEADGKVPTRLAEALSELQGEQVLLGMAALKLSASMKMASYAEALQAAGIRFQVYSCEGEKRTRTLGSQLGLETGWNCLISLEQREKDMRNMMGQVVLPSGIDAIRKHVADVDNVPLLVSLFSKATPSRAEAMMKILEDNGECVTCVASALQPNFGMFSQANISVSVLVGAVPQCQHCFGRREPLEGVNDLVVSNLVSSAEFQLSADLTSLPCALQARHSYSNGEQRTLGVLYNAIKEARRCVDCIMMVLIHYICGAAQLAVILSIQVLFCSPPPLEGIHLLLLLFVLLPAVSLALLGNAASPQLMKELPLKKADEQTLDKPGRMFVLYACRSVPTAIVVVAAFMQDLHRMFTFQLDEVRRGAISPMPNISACDGFAWHWWVTGRWPRCVEDLTDSTGGGSDRPAAGPWSGSGTSGPLDSRCAMVHAQQWSAMLFVLYELTLAFTFLDRYDSLVTRGPTSNKVLVGVTSIVLLVHAMISASVVNASCGGRWEESMNPHWEAWALLLGLWPVLAVAVSEGTKRRDRRYHMHLQKTLRVLFNTRLGMWSPK